MRRRSLAVRFSKVSLMLIMVALCSVASAVRGGDYVWAAFGVAVGLLILVRVFSR